MRTKLQMDSVSPIAHKASRAFQNAQLFQSSFGERLTSKHITAQAQPLSLNWFNTPLGPMLSIVDDKALYMLEFTGRKNLLKHAQNLIKLTERPIDLGVTQITQSIRSELEDYFQGQLKTFKTPTQLLGTAFQTEVWEALVKIPYGQTCSYKTLAAEVDNPKGFRAVANSNANNRLALIVPCHRVISSNGSLGGYAGGIDKKASLLALEKRHL